VALRLQLWLDLPLSANSLRAGEIGGQFWDLRKCPYMDSSSFASKLIWQAWHDCIRISGLIRWHALIYSRASPQSLCRTSSTWTFPGLADAGLTCLPLFSLLKQSSWRISCSVLSQRIAKSGS
jgi:hypothetical protein